MKAGTDRPILPLFALLLWAAACAPHRVPDAPLAALPLKTEAQAAPRTSPDAVAPQIPSSPAKEPEPVVPPVFPQKQVEPAAPVEPTQELRPSAPVPAPRIEPVQPAARPEPSTESAYPPLPPDFGKTVPTRRDKGREHAAPELIVPHVDREEPRQNRKAQDLKDLAASNDAKIMHVFVGMYRKTVEKIMGAEHNPYRRRTIHGSDGEDYDVLYYLTREPKQGRAVTDRMLTPVILKKGIVVAMGNYQLKKLQRLGKLERVKSGGAP